MTFRRPIESAEVQDFLSQFDDYAAVRATLKDMADGSEEERYCIADCAQRWNRLVLAREKIKL